MILKDYRKGWLHNYGYYTRIFCLSVVVDITKIMHGPFCFAHQFSLVFVYLTGGPRQLFFFQGAPETPKC